MKIALISSTYHPFAIGGGERSAQYLAEDLQKTGHEVFVITSHFEDAIEYINDVKVYRIKYSNIYWSYYSGQMPVFKKILWHIIESYNVTIEARVKPVLEQEKPDIVQIRNFQNFSAYIWKVVHDLRIPMVQTLNDYTSLCYKSTMYRHGHNCVNQCFDCKLISLPRKNLSRFVDTVIGVSKFTLNKHLDSGYFSNASSHVVYTSPPKVVRKSLPAIQKESVTFGYIGRIHPSKGVLEIIHVFNKLSGQPQLLIAGQGEKQYEKQCQHAMAEGNIKMLGKVSPEDFFNQVDVVIIPSLWHEPFPRVLVEAYSFGRPVIVSNCGGTQEQVIHGTTGFVFDAQDFTTLQPLVEKVVNDKNLLLQMHKNCLNFALTSRQKTDTAQYVDIYHQMVRNHTKNKA